MRRPAALFPISLALSAMMLAPVAGAREQGLTEIEKCQTISEPGSYKLVNNLTFKGATGACLAITVDFVTIDLAGFTISGPGGSLNPSAPLPNAIAAEDHTTGIAVRNGSISGFPVGVELSGDGSIVEGLRVSGGGPGPVGISATGIVRGNTVVGQHNFLRLGAGIIATGIVTGNFASRNDFGIEVGQGSTVIGNTARNNGEFGIFVDCPSNATDNTAVNNAQVNLELNGNGFNNTNNLAP